MKVLHYTVILEREEDGGFHAFVPALKGCHTQGDTLDEALENAREAIEAYLDSLKAEGEPIPIEDILVRTVHITLSPPQTDCLCSPISHQPFSYHGPSTLPI